MHTLRKSKHPHFRVTFAPNLPHFRPEYGPLWAQSANHNHKGRGCAPPDKKAHLSPCGDTPETFLDTHDSIGLCYTKTARRSTRANATPLLEFVSPRRYFSNSLRTRTAFSCSCLLLAGPSSDRSQFFNRNGVIWRELSYGPAGTGLHLFS
jgi:hypothetical protein